MDGDLERRITEPKHVEVRPLTEAEVRAAGAVAARALRDNPMMAYSVPAAGAPGACIAATAPTELRTPPDGSPSDAVGFERARHVISTMCRLDPDDRHVHVGPVGVEPGAQGLGIGAAMMRVACDRLDDDGELGWLETDKPENVVFYRRFGFDVDVEDLHLGFPVWFMRRPPR
jgi:ribosomal protein S18 acetylase RimI-like enzyme